MQWRDTQTHPPTIADACVSNEVLVINHSGAKFSQNYERVRRDPKTYPRWMPLRELPDSEHVPPPGFRFKVDNDVFTTEAKVWRTTEQRWVSTMLSKGYANSTYVVPIGTPVRLAYEPFTAETFDPYKDEWLEEVEDKFRVDKIMPDGIVANNELFTWQQALLRLRFADGRMFGVEPAK